MATAFIRIKVDLPDEEARRFVLEQRAGHSTDLTVGAKDIVAEVTAEVMAVLRRSPLHREYHAEITLAPR